MSRRTEVQRSSTPSSLSCTQVRTGNSGTDGLSPVSQDLKREITRVVPRGRQDYDEPLVDLDLPIAEYIRRAATENRESFEDFDGQAGWQGPTWTFTRYMRGYPLLKGLSSTQAAELVDRHLREMFPSVGDPWAHLFGDCDTAEIAHDPFEHFVEAWDSVTYELGEAPFEKALRLAEEHPVSLPELRSPRWAPYLRFLSVCLWLQQIQKPDPIFIPVRRFGAALGCPITTVSSYRKRAERSGYLLMVNEHVAFRRATEFKFDIEALRRDQRREDDEWEEL